jgi:hypothetical protein
VLTTPALLLLTALLQMIQDIRNRTGARVNMFAEEKGCPERILQVGTRPCSTWVTSLTA